MNSEKLITVRVKSSKHVEYWYSDLIGEVYTVSPSRTSMFFDYAIVDGYIPDGQGINFIPGQQPLLVKEDCIVVEPICPKYRVPSFDSFK